MLSSVPLLLARATPIRPYVACSTLCCGHACIIRYENSNCEVELPPNANLATDWAWRTTVIKVTSGVVTPFSLNMSLKSLSYVVPNTGDVKNCPSLQFSFYNALGQLAGVTHITPGQNYTPCVSFGNATVASYNGGNMNVPVPEDS